MQVVVQVKVKKSSPSSSNLHMNLIVGRLLICIRDQCRCSVLFNDTTDVKKSYFLNQGFSFILRNFHLCIFISYIVCCAVFPVGFCFPSAPSQHADKTAYHGAGQDKESWTVLCNFVFLPLRTTEQYSFSAYNTIISRSIIDKQSWVSCKSP